LVIGLPENNFIERNPTMKIIKVSNTIVRLLLKGHLNVERLSELETIGAKYIQMKTKIPAIKPGVA